MADTAELRDPNDIRPVVPRGSSGNTSLYIFGACLLIGGVVLFSALNERREELTAPRVTSLPAEPGMRIAPAPALVLPPDYALPDEIRDRRLRQTPPVNARPSSPPPQPAQVTRIVREEAVPAPQQPRDLPLYTPPARPQSSVVVDAPLNPNLSGTQPSEDGRVRARRLANPSVTVPQGTIIPAVLETAIDSTRPGGARALVQRDVHSFDGSRVLIPRGSRLYGTYEAGINPGEKRALVQWTRLLRPDGVTVALDSPSSDPLGRAGIEGDVSSRFFARFGGAILQSVLDLGVGLATSRASDGVIVALPGSTQNVTTQQSQARPVLKVDHGTSVSVFVARDLDFSSVE